MRKNVQTVDKNSREYLQNQFSGGRSSLLAVLIFTVVNLVMVLLDTGTQFLFSASVPYYLTFLGKAIDNNFSYGDWDVNGTFTITGLVIGVVVLVVYLLCWLLSKKRGGWLTAALVLFILDTVALLIFTVTLLEDPSANIMDFVFHGVIIWQLIMAVRANGKLKRLPPENFNPMGYYGAGPEF